ncbi:Hypothetical predicted protein [Marmota monax]|uniref:Uncharacterized protein n=1 Tax=Marmota monax TaxID=9995 RepID=A0A5E4BIT6_MARMO|nr:Hypothetical predicted protein [Marmota monax]
MFQPGEETALGAIPNLHIKIFGQASLIPQLFGHEQQVREAELSDQYEAACESACSEAESAAAEALDLPLPSYFRSRSHSYLRAIQAGCSQEEDSVSLQSLSPPPSTGSLSNSRTLPSEYGGDGGVLYFVFSRGTTPGGPVWGTAWEEATVGWPPGEAWLGVKAEGLALCFRRIGELELKGRVAEADWVGSGVLRLLALVASWLPAA